MISSRIVKRIWSCSYMLICAIEILNITLHYITQIFSLDYAWFNKCYSYIPHESSCLEITALCLAVGVVEERKGSAFGSCPWRRTRHTRNGGTIAWVRSQRQVRLTMNFKKSVLYILLRLLHQCFGLSDTVFDWIASFFHHQGYFVSTGRYSSKHHSLQFGVPQGSELGPLLFCLYISPLEQIFSAHDLKPILYADDTQLYVVLEESTITTTVERVNNYCLCDIISWSTSHKKSKTEIIHIRSKRRNMINTLPQIVVNSASIHLTRDARNLGVVFDDNLHFQKQINTVCSSAYLALNSIGKIQRYLDRQTCSHFCIVSPWPM